ncbi:hypothetical protein C8Q80DRAFT_1271889 [Daedaleopsis nitida]|nr:hypothetical protein C8Q80DRAFT_1271889 [Daedaleopsis nitida]
MAECTTCKRVLKNESALLQHCKDKGHPYLAPSKGTPPVPVRPPFPASASTSSTVPSAGPAPAASRGPHVLIECTRCSTTFTDKLVYDQHVVTKHPSKPYKCVPCALEFSSAEALSVHFRHFAVHPKCSTCSAAFLDQTQLNLHQAAHPKCGKCDSVFFNRAQLDEHVAVAHPVWKCVPCGREFASAAARKSHYQDSPTHPICFICREGFADDVEVDNHLARAHLDAKCRLCNRQFRQVEDLQSHYLTSSVHPHCALCEIGFSDDETCGKHMQTNHPRPPPRTPSPQPNVPPSPRSEFAQALTSIETNAPTHSVQSSPLVQRPTLNGVSFTTSLAVARVESDIDDDTYQTVEASSHVQRAISEPTVPTASSLGYGSVHDPAESAWHSPTLSERSVDYSKMCGMPRHPQSESTLSLQSAPSSVSSPSPRPESSLAGYPPSLHHPGQPPRVPDSSGMSPINSTRSFSSLAEHIARNAAPVIRPSLSRQPTPRIPSPLLSPARALSRTAPSASRGSSRPASSLHSKSSVLSAGARKASKESLSSDTEETVPGSTDTPKAPAISLPLPKSKTASKAKAKVGGVSWHCRICKQDPCAVPTATMCGHIFCTPCIVHELVKTGTCPVCRKTILLRLNVEPDLE